MTYDRVRSDHICVLPTYWAPIVAVGTTFLCVCERNWFLNEDRLWQSDEIDAEILEPTDGV